MEIKLEHNALPGSLEMAYLGDALYDLHVRKNLLARGGRVHALHKEAVKLVCAHAQAEALERVLPVLTEAESAVVRRARNAHQAPPRNANPAEYHRATALEALMGYLYITGQSQRLEEMLSLALPDAVFENKQ